MAKSGNKSDIGLSSLLSPILFSFFLAFDMTDLKSLCKEFKLDNNVSFDIRYADDTTMSTVFEKLQISTEAVYMKWGVKINFSKCKVITSSEKHIVLEGEELETVGEILSLEVSEMRCLWANRGVNRADRLQYIKIKEDTFTPESITDVIRHRILRWIGEVTSLCKHTNKTSKKSGREDGH